MIIDTAGVVAPEKAEAHVIIRGSGALDNHYVTVAAAQEAAQAKNEAAEDFGIATRYDVAPGVFGG